MAKSEAALDPTAEIDRPLRLLELLAETARVFSERFWTSLGLGLFVALTLLLGFATSHAAGFVAVVATAFTITWAVAARVVTGDSLRDAWSFSLRRVPALLPLGFIVAVPFALGRIDPLLMLLAILWVSLTGFSIPVSVLEHDSSRRRGWFDELQWSLARSVKLARAGYLHVAGSVAVYVLLYVLVGGLLVQALLGFASNGALISMLLAQLVLAPCFFYGLSILYYDQNARSRESTGGLKL